MRRCKDYGVFIAVLLEIVFPEALRVMSTVERYALKAEDKEVIAFMKTYTSSFNMIGVAVSIPHSLYLLTCWLSRQ